MQRLGRQELQRQPWRKHGVVIAVIDNSDAQDQIGVQAGDPTYSHFQVLHNDLQAVLRRNGHVTFLAAGRSLGSALGDSGLVPSSSVGFFGGVDPCVVVFHDGWRRLHEEIRTTVPPGILAEKVERLVHAYPKNGFAESQFAAANEKASSGNWAAVAAVLLGAGKSPQDLPSFAADSDRRKALELAAQAFVHQRDPMSSMPFLSALDGEKRYSIDDCLFYSRALAAVRGDAVSIAFLSNWTASYPANAELALRRAEHLEKTQRWDDALRESRRALDLGSEEVPCRRVARVSLTELARHSEALVEASILRSRGNWSMEDQLAYQRDQDACVPESMRTGRQTDTSLAKDIWSDLTGAGRWLGSLFGGGDPHLPFRQDVVDAAPKLIASDQVHATLDTLGRENSLRGWLARNPRAVDLLGAGAATTASHVYWLSTLDQHVLDAVTFSSSGNPETLRALRGATEWIDQAEGASLGGHLNRLSGYVAERRVAYNLSQSGHEVAFPDSATQPGYDLLVDGQPFQVKLTLNPSLIHEHLDRYPDVPVIVNHEVGGMLDADPRVLVDSNLDYHDVHATAQSAAENLHDGDWLGFELPVVAIGISLLRHRSAYSSGVIDTEKYAGRVLNDAVFRGLAGAGGAKVGVLIGGAIAGPVGAAAAGILGGIVGSAAGGSVADKRNLARQCERRDDVVTALGNFADWFRAGPLQGRLRLLQRRRDRYEEWAWRARSAGFPSDVVTAYESIVREAFARATSLSNWMATATTDSGKTNAGFVAMREIRQIACVEAAGRVSIVDSAMVKYRESQGQ